MIFMESVEMIKIMNADVVSNSYREFKKWITDKWGVVEELATEDNDYGNPLPLLAFDDLVVGGLSFATNKDDDGNDMLWINSLFVVDTYRHLGIGTKLVLEAEKKAIAHGVKELFAYTEIPELYKKLSWVVLEVNGENSVVMKRLNK